MLNSISNSAVLNRFRTVSLAALTFGAGILFNGCQKTDSPTGPTDSKSLISITSPMGGETFKVGDTLWVKWTVKEDPVQPVDAVDILISPDMGATWGFVRSGSVPIESGLWGKYPYVVKALSSGSPSVNFVSTKCLVRVMQYSTSDSTKIATTKTAFTISAQ